MRSACASRKWFWLWTNRLAIAPACILARVARSDSIPFVIDIGLAWLTGPSVGAVALSPFLVIFWCDLSLRIFVKRFLQLQSPRHQKRPLHGHAAVREKVADGQRPDLRQHPLEYRCHVGNCFPQRREADQKRAVTSCEG